MQKPVWTLRPEDWLVADLNEYANTHNLTDRTLTIHQYILDLKKQNHQLREGQKPKTQTEKQTIKADDSHDYGAPLLGVLPE